MSTITFTALSPEDMLPTITDAFEGLSVVAIVVVPFLLIYMAWA